MVLRPVATRLLKGRPENRLARRRLDIELVRRRLVDSRAAAQAAIVGKRVKLKGTLASKAATMVESGDPIEIVDDGPRHVSRAGAKLEAAIEAGSINIDGRRAIDVGASTGGFTDCLLQHGAVSVLALDVGYGQLDWSLRSDSRVTVMDRTNVRHVEPSSLGAPFDVVVVDLSFISLTKVLHVLAELGDDSSDWVMLVKPQFEVGPDRVASGGVVRDPVARGEAIRAVVAAAEEFGLRCCGGMDSPIPGAKSGNVEHLLWFKKGTSGA